ncbi:hypothetical protein FJ365_03640 [Candidatus Dependentiae bacterium]|nr:hypothetical protein [Candidatus Dependentiae bacterium]
MILRYFLAISIALGTYSVQASAPSSLPGDEAVSTFNTALKAPVSSNACIKDPRFHAQLAHFRGELTHEEAAAAGVFNLPFQITPMDFTQKPGSALVATYTNPAIDHICSIIDPLYYTSQWVQTAEYEWISSSDIAKKVLSKSATCYTLAELSKSVIIVQPIINAVLTSFGALPPESRDAAEFSMICTVTNQLLHIWELLIAADPTGSSCKAFFSSIHPAWTNLLDSTHGAIYAHTLINHFASDLDLIQYIVDYKPEIASSNKIGGLKLFWHRISPEYDQAHTVNLFKILCSYGLNLNDRVENMKMLLWILLEAETPQIACIELLLYIAHECGQKLTIPKARIEHIINPDQTIHNTYSTLQSNALWKNVIKIWEHDEKA